MKKVLMILSIFLPSKLRILFLNFMGHKISRKATLSPFSILIARKIAIEESAKIDSFSVVAGLNSLIMKKASAISRFTYISGGKNLFLSERSLIGSRCILNIGSGDINFGEYSVLAPRSTIYTHGTFLPVTHGYSNKNKGVSVGDFTWIMQNTSIGPGVKIGSNIIVLPGSIIVKSILDNSVVFDSPVERKTFPISLFKKELSDIDLEHLIKEITNSYINDLLDKGKIKSFEMIDEVIKVTASNHEIYIHFRLPDSIIIENDSSDKINCFFSYRIDKDIINSTNNFTLDFLKIIKSKKKPPVEFENFNKFMFYEYGLKFI